MDLEDHENPDWPTANQLDRDIARGMRNAEKHCGYLGKDPWSPKLKKARLKVEILKLTMSMCRTKKDYPLRIDKLVGVYGNPIEIPGNERLVQASLQTAQTY